IFAGQCERCGDRMGRRENVLPQWRRDSPIMSGRSENGYNALPVNAKRPQGKNAEAKRISQENAQKRRQILSEVEKYR
ncbi:MAG: hypothetical protein FWE95_05035, partial [Planctomycetaceae bacterium]|nr:hypothetical protein [Planctomycetaceae bacterium]